MFTALYLQAFEKDLVAQLVEHLPFKERVLGSSPSQVTFRIIIPLTRDLYFKNSSDAEIGRQAWLRAMCSYERAGSTPALSTLINRLFF